MSKHDETGQLYLLAKEIFLKRAPPEFFNDKSIEGYKAQADNAIKVAQFFLDQFEKKDEK